ncbi:MAG: ATP-binding cassette domain-containing protein [Rhodobacteraceae bacterium]|nr:ATP-binding cassette domain-containing protein [Paracoccaceae bacterium]
MSAPLLEVRGVTRRYRMPREALLRSPPVLTAVNDVSFVLERGQTLGVVGESGSGKSTLARMIMAFEAPDEGAVLFEGQDINRLGAAALRQARQRFQMVFQDPFGSLDPRRTVAWSIAEPLRVMRAEGIDRRIAEALDQVGLRARDGEKYPHEFSGGQRQRIAIARAIVTRPALLVADEAVSALDVSVQAQILNLLMDLQEDLGLAMVFISHDLAVVACICDQMLVMRHGDCVEFGDTAGIVARPRHDYTRSLLVASGI